MTELEKSMLSFCFTTSLCLVMVSFGIIMAECFTAVIDKIVEWYKAFKEKRRKG